MKKIIALLLIAVCGLTLIACNPDKGDAKLDAFKDAVSATSATEATVETTLSTELGDLNGTYTITYATDGSATIAYSYEKFNEITDDTKEIKSKVEGTVTYNEDGTWSDNGTFAGDNAVAISFTINLDASKMTYNINGNTLTGTVTADNSESVFGVKLPSDATLVLVKNDTGIATVTLAYTTEVGTATVTIAY